MINKKCLTIAKKELATIAEEVEAINLKTIPALEKNFQRVGASYIHVQAIPRRN